MTEKYKVFYDEQCEICQAGGSWLRILDVEKLIDLVPIEEETIANQNFGLDEALARNPPPAQRCVNPTLSGVIPTARAR